MRICIDLSPAAEKLLLKIAEADGKDVEVVASEIFANALKGAEIFRKMMEGSVKGYSLNPKSPKKKSPKA